MERYTQFHATEARISLCIHNLRNYDRMSVLCATNVEQHKSRDPVMTEITRVRHSAG